MITPFGLLGKFTTKGFKSRLHKQYRRPVPTSSQYPGDVAETMRLEAFLRDFVIEFGPADTEQMPEQTDPHGQTPRTHEPSASEHSDM